MDLSKRAERLLLLMLPVVLLPTAARADTGTVLMLATAFHLLIGNALIGVFEGLLIAGLFRLAKLRTVAIFIGANYFSMVAGGMALPSAWSYLAQLFSGQPPLYRVPTMLGWMWAFSWLLSVVLEWPFCVWALRAGRKQLGKAWKVSLIAQTASYALLTPYYFSASNLSLYREAHVQRNLSFVHHPAAIVYYIDPRDGSIWRVGTDGSRRLKVATPIHSHYGQLVLRPDRVPGCCSLYLVGFNDEGTSRISMEVKLLSGIQGRWAAIPPTPGYSEVADLRSGAEQEWTIKSGQFTWGALSVRYRNQTVYRLGMETPFFHWTCDDITVLPGDQAVFMAGYTSEDAEVLVLDMKTRNLGLLAVGRSPVVVLPPK